MFIKLKATKIVVVSEIYKIFQQKKNRKIERKKLNIVKQMKMIILKKTNDSKREIEQKTNIKQRIINAIYRRIMRRSMKLQIFYQNFRCYKMKTKKRISMI